MPEPGSNEEKVWDVDDYDTPSIEYHITQYDNFFIQHYFVFIAFLDRSCCVECKYNFYLFLILFLRVI